MRLRYTDEAIIDLLQISITISKYKAYPETGEQTAPFCIANLFMVTSMFLTFRFTYGSIRS